MYVQTKMHIYLCQILLKKGNQAITQNESIPYVSISNKTNDKSCFGVISSGEDPNERIDRYGAFSTPYEKEKGDTRIYINSVGEGSIWITNKKMDLLNQEIILLLVIYQDMELNNQMIFYIIILLRK